MGPVLSQGERSALVATGLQNPTLGPPEDLGNRTPRCLVTLLPGGLVGPAVGCVCDPRPRQTTRAGKGLWDYRGPWLAFCPGMSGRYQILSF